MRKGAAPPRSSPALAEYRRKRRFGRTQEPAGAVSRAGRATATKRPAGAPSQPMFVVQKHAASNLHYDFRLELDGTLKSWAVPKGPSLDPAQRRLAVHVEDHPIEYGAFEGTIPQGEYGGGTVMVWDSGAWEPVGDAREGLAAGKLTFELHGRRLLGRWSLVRMRRGGDDDGILRRSTRSAATDRTLQQIADAEGHTGRSGQRGGAAGVAAAARRRPSSRRPLPNGDDPLGVAKLSQSKRVGRVPTTLAPQLATLVDVPPSGDEWLHEIKYDGYRLLCGIDQDAVRLVTRGGQVWTARFPELASVLSGVSVRDTVIDGEIVAVDETGASSFQGLQDALRSASRGSRGAQLVFWAFDVPFCGGFDLRASPLLERKLLLERLIDALPARVRGGVLRYSDHVIGRGDEVFATACRTGLEGVVSKRVDASYQSGRSRSWQKCKCGMRQEFVIGGFTRPSGSRTGFGALLLGVRERGKLVYAGRVGTGFDDRTLRTLAPRLIKLEESSSSFDRGPTASERRGVRWVKPILVAEVSFAQWTSDGRLRHPSFEGLREDKPAEGVRRERPRSIARHGGANDARRKEPARRKAVPRVASSPTARPAPRLTHPDRILYPDTGATKADLAAYYERVASRMLAHIAQRPLTLVRCPSGTGASCFYQKHPGEHLPAALGTVMIREKTASKPYMTLDRPEGLAALVQLGTLEIHGWGCRADDIEHPDRLVFDLDPGPGVAWPQVIAAAQTVRRMLADVGLTSFVMTSGGKGLHVAAPLRPSAGWEEAKTFARAVAQSLERHDPRSYVSVMTKSKRRGRIFVDYLRNARGATSIAPYSTRARPGAPVAMPVSWTELARVTAGDAFTMRSAAKRLARSRADPWAGWFRLRQALP